MAGPAIVEGIGSAALLQAMDENLWAFWRDYGRRPGAELHKETDLRWFASGVPLAVFNGVPHVRLAEDGVEPALARIQTSVSRRGAACRPCGGSARTAGQPTSRHAWSGMG